MNKEKFLNVLEKNLKNLSKKDKEEIINEYKNHIYESFKHGYSEKETLELMGNPKDIAKELNYINTVKKYEGEPTTRNLYMLILSISKLSMLNIVIFFVLVFVLIICLPVLLLITLSSFFMILSPFYLLYLIGVNGVQELNVNNLFQVIKGISLGTVGFIFLFFLYKKCKIILKKFIEWNKNKIKGMMN